MATREKRLRHTGKQHPQFAPSAARNFDLPTALNIAGFADGAPAYVHRGAGLMSHEHAADIENHLRANCRCFWDVGGLFTIDEEGRRNAGSRAHHWRSCEKRCSLGGRAYKLLRALAQTIMTPYTGVQGLLDHAVIFTSADHRHSLEFFVHFQALNHHRVEPPTIRRLLVTFSQDGRTVANVSLNNPEADDPRAAEQAKAILRVLSIRNQIDLSHVLLMPIPDFAQNPDHFMHNFPRAFFGLALQSNEDGTEFSAGMPSPLRLLAMVPA